MAEQVGLLTKGPHNVRLQIATEGSCSCSAEDDTVAHFFLECPVFEPQREALRDVVPVGMWKWSEAAQFFVSSPEAFHASFCEEALYLKERLGVQSVRELPK